MPVYIAFQRADGGVRMFLTAAATAPAAYTAALDLIAPRPYATADSIVIEKWDTDRQLMLNMLDIGVTAYALTDEGAAFADDVYDAYRDAVSFAHEIYELTHDSSPTLDAAKAAYTLARAAYADAMRQTPLPSGTVGTALWLAYKDAENAMNAATDDTFKTAVATRNRALATAAKDFNTALSAIVDDALAAF